VTAVTAVTAVIGVNNMGGESTCLGPCIGQLGMGNPMSLGSWDVL
jgi:hypothetical protein